MPKKISKQELAYDFRYALATDFSVAESLLSKHPDLIDHPVYGQSESALHFYSTENQLEIVAWLIDHGANPNGIAENDYPLIGASQLGRTAVCQALLSAGANPNSSDSLGETALHKASEYGRLDTIELLLELGADPSIKEMCGELPVEQALPRKSEQVKAIFDGHTATNPTKA